MALVLVKHHLASNELALEVHSVTILVVSVADTSSANMNTKPILVLVFIFAQSPLYEYYSISQYRLLVK